MSNEQRLYRERLMNVAKALRESPTPQHKFTMDYYSVPDCGTPSCALGHYAAREDLQSEFSLGTNAGALVRRSDGKAIWHSSADFLRHFGLDPDEAHELFSGHGCGNAQSALDAAIYIENFVAQKYALTALERGQS